MSSKRLIWAGMIVGSSVGSFLPMLWGDSFVSMTSVILTALGGFVGIYLGYKLGQMLF
jgi:hypothetical protein